MKIFIASFVALTALAQTPLPSTAITPGQGSVTGGTCTNQVVTAISSAGVPTCATVTSTKVDNSIALTGTDINTSNQVTATHLASPLPQAQGGLATAKIAFTPPATAWAIAPIADNQTTNVFGGNLHATQSVTFPVSDLICAHAGDTTINSLTCTNTVTDATGAYQNFATLWSQPASFWTAGREVEVCGDFEYYSSTTAPTVFYQLQRGGPNQLYGVFGALTGGGGKSNVGFPLCWRLKASDSVAHVYTTLISPYAFATSNQFNVANVVAQPTSFGAGSNTVGIGFQFSATGIASGTYTSGISATGTIGQTCTLSSFNNGNASGTATVALTGTNTIAVGTALVITNTGNGSTSAATSATAGNGTATCSGTATVATVLGGAQGNGVWLQALHVAYIN